MNPRPSLRFPLHVLVALAVLALLAPLSLAAQPGRGSSSLQPATVITVTSTADSGPGTLRQALLTVQSGDTITFDSAVFPPASPSVIALTSALPDLSQGSLTIDASNMGVILDGSQISASDADGLRITSSGNTIRGLQIREFPRMGIQIWMSNANVIGGDSAVGTGPSGQGNVIVQSSGSGIDIGGGQSNIVTGNRIGTNAVGASAQGNYAGVELRAGSSSNRIGGSAPGIRNVISGNAQDGVRLTDPGTISNVVRGNYIGTNAAGTAALPNGMHGVQIVAGAAQNIIGGSTPGERNVISGNQRYGIRISDLGTDGNIVTGNYIGVDKTGNAALGNNSQGIVIALAAKHNRIGGATSGERNIVSGNGCLGIGLGDPGTAENVVLGNYVGLNASGTAALGNGCEGVEIFEGPQENTIGGDSPAARNVISGNARDGVIISGSGTFSNTVSGNYIGTNAAGTAALPNGMRGVRIAAGAAQNVIGGSTPGERNVISGNRSHGVSISGNSTLSNTVSGNYIGTDASGSIAVGNAGYGVDVRGGPKWNVIGGNTPGRRNVISGNDGNGIAILDLGTDHNVVTGNFIGTSASGTAALANAWDGVGVWNGARDNTVGGSDPGAGNLISGNGGSGVWIEGSGTMHNVVQGNFIGTNASGTARLPNEGSGINIRNGAHDNHIGGAAHGEGNVISGNGAVGVYIRETGTVSNTVSGNYIGTNLGATQPISNTYDSVAIDSGAQYNIIGGALPGAGNVIAVNGVSISDNGSMFNRVLGNYIGINPAGTVVMGCESNGVGIRNGASYNRIGGLAPGERNVISGNDNGVQIGGGPGTDYNEVLGNYIGINPTGTAVIGAGDNGVYVWEKAKHNRVEGNVIGGAGNGIWISQSETTDNVVAHNYVGTDVTQTMNWGNTAGIGCSDGAQRNVIGPGNVVAFNQYGIYTNNPTTLQIRITQNAVFGNINVGIGNYNGGNTQLAAPVITQILDGRTAVGTACAGCTVEVFSDADGQGRVYEGTTVADGSGHFTLTLVCGLRGPNVTATATDASGNTSVFSAPVSLGAAPVRCLFLPAVLRN